MGKPAAHKPFENFLPRLEGLAKDNLVLIYSFIVGLSIANLVAAANLLTVNIPQDLVTQSQAASLPILKILTPSQNSEASGEVPIILAFNDGSEGFKSLTALIDEVVDFETSVAGENSLSLILDTTELKNGPHSLTFQATDIKDRTQTLKLDLNFSN